MKRISQVPFVLFVCAVLVSQGLAAPAISKGAAAAPGSILWQLQLDGAYSSVRPAVARSGNVYVVDVTGTLYAVSPNGTLLWKVAGAGGKGVAVSPNETIYVGSESFVRAFRPTGSRKWSFRQSPGAYLFVGLGVGPDRNLYCLATNGLGIFSLTPLGKLRWANAELFNQPIVSYGEIAFGPGPAQGSPAQLYFYANHHLRALTLDGSDVFTLNPGGMQPVVSLPDGTMHLDKSAYFPDGTQYWFNFDIFGSSNVVLGRDGNHYQASYVSDDLYALDPTGSLKWNSTDPDFITASGVDPVNTRVLFVGNDAVDFGGVISAYDTVTGSRAWRLKLPPFNGFNQIPELQPGFSADGSVAYYVNASCAVGHACLTAVAVK
jgi:outer membrane protein assembly factor BamB